LSTLLSPVSEKSQGCLVKRLSRLFGLLGHWVIASLGLSRPSRLSGVSGVFGSSGLSGLFGVFSLFGLFCLKQR